MDAPFSLYFGKYNVIVTLCYIVYVTQCYINNEEVNIIKTFKDAGINIQKADIPFVKVLISDSKEMMHTYTKFSEDKREVIPETAIGIWNKYEDVARNYDERFLNQLEKMKMKQRKNKTIEHQ